jgi:phosphoribosyl 1,2-cyclic phosphodiesterase
MRIVPIASSSKGNAYAVIAGGEVVLIDCGLSCKQLCLRCDALGVDLSLVSAVMITHDHSDHIGGLRVFLGKYNVPVYANLMTAEKIAHDTGIEEMSFVCFENGQSFELGCMKVTPFSTPHDAVDSVGYLIEAEGRVYFHGTDIGTPLDSVGKYLSCADVATLESNHDLIMLSQSTRQPSLKRRIAGPRGHLSNDEAASLVLRHATARLKKIFLAHLSGECNCPHIAKETMEQALTKIGRQDIELVTL